MSEVLDRLIDESRLTWHQRLANALFLYKAARTFEEFEPTPDLYCPLCREYFPTNDEAQPPYAAIHQYTGFTDLGTNEEIVKHLHPITREEVS